MRRHVLVLAAVGAAGLVLLLSSAAAARPGVKLTATPPLVTSRTTATFKWIARTGTRRTRCRLRWQALPGTRDKASSLARRRAKLRRCSSPTTWTKLVRGGYTFVLIADGRRASTSTRYSWRVVRGSARGRQFSGTFDCYGTTGCKRLPAAARCTRTISSGLQSALNSASGGTVICLNAGSYGNVSLSSKAYSSDVIVHPVAGATATIGSVTLRSVAHLRLSGLGGTLQSGNTRVSGPSSKHITFDHIVYTACMRFDGTSSSAAILVDHDRLDNLGVGLAGCGSMGEGRLQVQGSYGEANGWLTVTNTHFGGQAGGAGDCSDGIQLGDTDGVIVGPGNEFTGITQGSCGAHADPIQFYGGKNVTITGNYFHDNGNGSAGITNYDSGSGPYTVTNNVLVGPFSSGAGWNHDHRL